MVGLFTNQASSRALSHKRHEAADHSWCFTAASSDEGMECPIFGIAVTELGTINGPVRQSSAHSAEPCWRFFSTKHGR